jgi:hypothetical protein
MENKYQSELLDFSEILEYIFMGVIFLQIQAYVGWFL